MDIHEPAETRLPNYRIESVRSREEMLGFHLAGRPKTFHQDCSGRKSAKNANKNEKMT